MDNRNKPLHQITKTAATLLALAGFAFCLAFGVARVADAEPVLHPFAQTGLTARPDESAEEILLRAHEGDARAISLVVAGYSMGVGGFPRWINLAEQWTEYAFKLGAVQTSSFCRLLTNDKTTQKKRYEKDSAAQVPCEFVEGSPLIPGFREAGLFDAEKLCARILGDRQGELLPAWKTLYEDQKRVISGQAAQTKADVKLMRELVARPITREELVDLLARNWAQSREKLVFFAATTHDIEAGTPDWKNERVESFIRVQREGPFYPAGKEGAASSGVSVVELVKTAEAMLNRRENFNREAALELVRNAHAGDAQAAFDLAGYYNESVTVIGANSKLRTGWHYLGLFSAKDEESIVKRIDGFLADGKNTEGVIWGQFLRQRVKKPLSHKTKERLEKLDKLEETLSLAEQADVESSLDLLLDISDRWNSVSAGVQKAYGPTLDGSLTPAGSSLPFSQNASRPAPSATAAPDTPDSTGDAAAEKSAVQNGDSEGPAKKARPSSPTGE